MDTNIRKLLAKAEKFEAGEKNIALLQAFKLLQNVADTRPINDTPESCGMDLYVLCAEFAYEHGYTDVAKECIRMYFMKKPPENQFLCRAYFCQAQLMIPENSDNPELFEKAAACILKAILFAKEIERYHFLVYNASVIYWKLCQPFLKPGYRHHLTHSLHQVQKALNDIDDNDHVWRAQIMITLIECYLDAHHHSDASRIASDAAAFIKTNVPSLYKTIFRIIVQHNLVDTVELFKDIESSPELKLFYQICKLKIEIASTDQVEAESSVFSSSHQSFTRNINKTPENGSLIEVLADKHNKIKDEEFIATDEDMNKTRNIFEDIQNILYQIGVLHKQEIIENVNEAEPASDLDVEKMPTDEQKLDKHDRALLILEMCHLCIELEHKDLAIACMETLKQIDIRDGGFHLELEFIECELMMLKLEEKQETYEKSVIDVRLQAVKTCNEAVMNAIRFGDPKVIQVGCVTLWNICLPLLQPNLRHLVHKPIALIADSLETIDSLQVRLRCEAHIELAQCHEDKDQVEVAMGHLKKALSLDIENMYHERIQVLLHRLELRNQLYSQPERPEDQAAMIIEQARKVDYGTVGMKRSLLVKAGEILAPDAFLTVLDSENDTKEHSGKGSLVNKLAGKAQHFTKCVSKAEEHLKRVKDLNIKERARLWGDLAKTARKQNIWDVCRVACRFCLLYKDGCWRSKQQKQPSRQSEEKSRSDIFKEKDVDAENRSSISKTESVSTESQPASLYDENLNIMLAEVSFINGEALIQLLRSENFQLNDKPSLSGNPKNAQKDIDALKLDDLDWVIYRGWIKSLSEQATGSFLHGMALGIELDEAWIVINAATYVWNYNHHIISQGRHSEIVPHLVAILEGLKKCGPAVDTVMLLNICNALAQGLIRPWIPDVKDLVKPVKESAKESPKIAKGKGVKSILQSRSKMSIVSEHPDAMTDLKKAIDICEFAMHVSDGDGTKAAAPIFHRVPILQSWVQAKQLAQQQIQKNVVVDSEENPDKHKEMKKSVVGMEIISFNKNGIMEFKESPSLEEVIMMVESIKWTDKLVELQVWTKLTSLAFEEHLHSSVIKCSMKALRFAALGTQPYNRKIDLLCYTVEQEMFSYSSVLQGQSLMETMQGKNSTHRLALEAFLNSAKYARCAGNYALVMTAARHFWNACVPLVVQPKECDMLREPIKIILECISASTSKVKKEKIIAEVPSGRHVSEEKSKDAKQKNDNKEEILKQGDKNANVKVNTGITEKLDDDLSLRAAMYGVLFQSYANKGKWTEALDAIEKALAEMPRTSNRLLIFKHRLLIKAKLGQPILMDIFKFKDETEEILANMWHKAAKSYKNTTEQLTSYQCAIEALENDSSCYQKVIYLLEFAQWLYTNQFPVEDAQSQLGWTIDILLNIKPPDSQAAIKQSKGKKGKVNKGVGKLSDKGIKKDSVKSVASQVTHSADSAIGAGASSHKMGTKISLHAKDSHSVSSDHDIEFSAASYVPVTKVAEIGVLPTNPELTVNDLVNVRQLDALIISHVLLAEISGMESPQYKDALLMAHQFLMRLWKVLINACASSLRSGVKAKPSTTGKEDVKTTKPGAAGAKKDDKKDDKKKEEKPKPKRRCPIDVLPSDVDTWSTYDWPDEGLDVFKIEDLQHVAITQNNIPKPMLTYYYLNQLITQLRAIGYSHLTLPVLAFQDLLSRSVLKSNALYMLVHLRSFEVCQELNLKTGISHHQRIIGPMHINVEDQAMSRTEIAKWQEKLNQETFRESEVEMNEGPVIYLSTTSFNSKTQDLQKFTNKLKNDSKSEDNLTPVLSGVCLREVWTDIAEILIRLGFYQKARDFLNEANIAAQAFDDHTLHARIMLQFAKLAYYEAQYGLAINLCIKAQNLKQGDERFWFDLNILHAKAIMKDNEDTWAVRKAKHVLENAVREFTKAGMMYQNRRNMATFYCAKLEAKLLKIHFKSIQQKHNNTNSQPDDQSLLKGCECYEHLCELLMQFYCFRDVVNLARKHGRILRTIAVHSTNRELQRMYYCQALNVFKQAALIAEQVYTDVHTLSSLSEMKGVITPVQRELADVNLELGEILTDVFLCQEKELRHKQLQEERKASIVQLVQEYIWELPVFEGKEKLWNELGRIAADEAMACLLCVFSLCGGMPYLKARCLAGLGRLLRLVSEHHGPDPPSRWIVHDIETLRLILAEEEEQALAAATAALETSVIEDDEEDEATDNTETLVEEQSQAVDQPEEAISSIVQIEEEIDEKKIARYKQQMIVKKNKHETSQFYYKCASECLSQSLFLSLQNHFSDVAATVSFEMLTLIGQHDPSAASMMLSLYQSCQSSQIIEQVLTRSQSDPLTSQLAALLHQRQHLLKKDIQTNLSNSPLYKEITSILSHDWQAWKKLEITTNHLDLLKDMPSNYIMIILQHSADKNFLYGSVLDKPKGSNVKAPKTNDKNMGRSRIFETNTDANQLRNILSKIIVYKQKQQNMLLKREYQQANAAARKKLLQNLDKNFIKTDDLTPVEDVNEDAKLDTEFMEIVELMNLYLRPVLEPICNSLK